jgi:arylsulfatase A-like enzyme
MLPRREFIGALAASSAQAQPARPNIVVFVSDQQHWRAAGFADPFFDTPHLDALAKESAVFDTAFCSTPQCSPSRSSLYTGDYPSRTGVYGNIGSSGGNPLKQDCRNVFAGSRVPDCVLRQMAPGRRSESQRGVD